MYLPETNILITRFLAEEGVSELTDYMPIDNDGGEPNEIVRKVAVIRGDVGFQMCCKPRFSYATCGHQLELSELCATFRPFSSDCPPMSLHSTVRLGRAGR
jgi:GH15 family glucan-1,4-alpha-glucosidase